MMKHALDNKAKNRELGRHTLGMQVGARAYDPYFSAGLCRGSRHSVSSSGWSITDLELHCPGSSLVLPRTSSVTLSAFPTLSIHLSLPSHKMR